MPQGPVRLVYCHRARKFRDAPDPKGGADAGSLVGDLLLIVRYGPAAAAAVAAGTLGNLACIDEGAAALREAGAERGLLDAVGHDRDPAVHEAAAGTPAGPPAPPRPARLVSRYTGPRMVSSSGCVSCEAQASILRSRFGGIETRNRSV